MAERKSGPVKPPVIDLTAREADSPAETDGGPAQAPRGKAGPEPEAAESPAGTSAEFATQPDTPAEPPRPNPVPPPPPPRPPARLAMPWSAISIAAIAGALLGTALTYALVNFVPLDRRPAIADPTARLEEHQQAIASLQTRLVPIEDQLKRTQVSLDATIAQLDNGLTSLKQSVAAIPPPQDVDLAPLAQRVSSLESRLTAMGAGASSADAAALAETIASIQSELAQLRTRLETSDGRVAEATGAVAAMEQQVNEAKAAIAAQNTKLGGVGIGPAIRLPLVVAGIEQSVASGRAYADELASLTALLPDLDVPEAIRAAASTGLPRPDAVAARFEARVPEILAAGSTGTTGDLGQDALAWMKGVLALRPAGEMDGDTPEAVLSRLEAALGRGDFADAATLLDQLPPPMQAAAGETAEDLRLLAAADAFVSSLRTKALAPAAEAAQ